MRIALSLAVVIAVILGIVVLYQWGYDSQVAAAPQDQVPPSWAKTIDKQTEVINTLTKQVSDLDARVRSAETKIEDLCFALRVVIDVSPGRVALPGPAQQWCSLAAK